MIVSAAILRLQNWQRTWFACGQGERRRLAGSAGQSGLLAGRTTETRLNNCLALSPAAFRRFDDRHADNIRVGRPDAIVPVAFTIYLLETDAKKWIAITAAEKPL